MLLQTFDGFVLLSQFLISIYYLLSYILQLYHHSYYFAVMLAMGVRVIFP